METAQLRGNYSRAGADFSVAQEWDAHTPEEHDLYRKLYARQSALVPSYACPEFNAALAGLDASHAIPRFDAVSGKLRKATGWEIVAVPGLIPDEAFFRTWPTGAFLSRYGCASRRSSTT